LTIKLLNDDRLPRIESVVWLDLPGKLLLLVMAFLLGLPGVAGLPSTVAAQEAIACASPGSPVAEQATPAPIAAAEAEFPNEGGDLTVFAAASLTDAFNQIKSDLEAAHPGLSINFNFAGSQALVTQIEQGAEADLFASANTTQMQAAVDAGLIDGDPAVFARNKLAIVVPADNPAGIVGPVDLAQDDLKLVLAAPEVPVGTYSRESICLMGAGAATYGDGFVERVDGNIVSNEDNVKAVLAKVQLGEADAGIVYTTDVSSDLADQVTLIPIPDEVNVIASYPVAAVAGGDLLLAQAFMSYLIGPDGQATLQAFGFAGRDGA
jgi:molybdate transport system substrate-binding protein